MLNTLLCLQVYGDVEVLWSRADEPVDIRAFTQHPCDDVVDESVSLKDLLPSDDDDVIILDNSDVKAEQIAECNSCENVVPDVITILSSSDEGEGPCDGAIDEGEGFRAEVGPLSSALRVRKRVQEAQNQSA